VDKHFPDTYSKEPYVFESISNSLRFEADGTGQRDLTFRARIQSESAIREFGLLTYPFASSFENLEIDYVRVRKPDGSTVDTPAADVQELDSAVSREAPMYTDSREKHIAVKSLVWETFSKHTFDGWFTMRSPPDISGSTIRISKRVSAWRKN
jgi:hypothetical protein